MRLFRVVGALFCFFSAFSAVHGATPPAEAGEAQSPMPINIRVSPLGLIFGSYDLNVDFPMAANYSLGAYGQYINMKIGDVTAKGMGIGARINFALNGPLYTDGFYLGPMLQFQKLKIDGTLLLSPVKIDATSTMIGVIVGYGWYWPSGFNVMFGVGPGYGKASGDFEVTQSDGTKSEVDDAAFQGTQAVGELTMGFTF